MCGPKVPPLLLKLCLDLGTRVSVYGYVPTATTMYQLRESWHSGNGGQSSQLPKTESPLPPVLSFAASSGELLVGECPGRRQTVATRRWRRPSFAVGIVGGSGGLATAVLVHRRILVFVILHLFLYFSAFYSFLVLGNSAYLENFKCCVSFFSLRCSQGLHTARLG
jgi:hypothetical protein